MTTGFTLAELLISLAIVGVIMAFTIPKVLEAQNYQTYNANAKEVASMVSQAYQLYKMQNGASATMAAKDLTPYLNNLRTVTSGSIDNAYGGGTHSCSAANPCFLLHSGALLYFTSQQFGGTAATNAVFFHFDPNGVAEATTNTPGKSVEFELYYNGRILTWGTALPNTCSDTACWNPNPSRDPPWFSWN